MGIIKIVSWNIGHLERLIDEPLNSTKQKRKKAIINEIKNLAPDVLCIIEGPNGEVAIDFISNQ